MTECVDPKATVGTDLEAEPAAFSLGSSRAWFSNFRQPNGLSVGLKRRLLSPLPDEKHQLMESEKLPF